MVELRYFNANVRFRILLSYLNNMYEFTLAKFFNLFWFISCFNMFLLQNWQSYSTSKYTFFSRTLYVWLVGKVVVKGTKTCQRTSIYMYMTVTVVLLLC